MSNPAYAALIEDLGSAGLLDETLVLVAGEFGRTIGSLSNVRIGWDHYLQMFYALAGGGVSGGRLIGETNRTGAFHERPGIVTVSTTCRSPRKTVALPSTSSVTPRRAATGFQAHR